MMHRRRPAALAAGALLTLGLLATVSLAGCAASADPSTNLSAAEPVHVRLAPVARGPVERPIRAAGTVAAKDAWNLSFKVGGIVARVLVRDGDQVRRGQVLTELNATEVAAAVRQAREGLAKAERDRGRARKLAAEEVIAAAAAEDAETAAAVAAAAVSAAEFNLGRTVLVARDDGWVDRRLVEPGEVVAPGQPVLRVSGRGGGFVVRAALADRDAVDVAPGDAASVTIDARAGEPIPGRVAEIARSPSPGTGTYEIEIALDPAGTPRDLLAGLTAKARIARTVPAAGVVPLAAVVDGDGAEGAVFAIEGDRARRIPVRIAFLQGDVAVLASGIDGVERVVTDGASRVADGTPVRIVP